LNFKARDSFLKKVTQESTVEETFERGVSTRPDRLTFKIKGKEIGVGKGWKGGVGFKWIGRKVWIEERDGGVLVYYKIE